MKKIMLPPTSRRVSMRTDPSINAEIRNQTIKNLNIFRNCNEPELSDRIRTLDMEWDIERVTAAKTSIIILICSYLGIKMGRIWFLITGAIGVFMMLHAIQGWCPTMPCLRKWGIRTSEEISAEKTALKFIRGDFKGEVGTAADALGAAEKE